MQDARLAAGLSVKQRTENGVRELPWGQILFTVFAGRCAEQVATVMHPTNRQQQSPPHVSHSCGSCPLQDAMLAAGLSEKYEVKTAVTDAAD